MIFWMAHQHTLRCHIPFIFSIPYECQYSSNNADLKGKVLTITSHPKFMYNGIMVATAANAKRLDFMWPYSDDQPS